MNTVRLIRGIMQKYDKRRVFNNKHKTCRSIKCYQTDIVRDKRMIAELEEELSKLSIPFLIYERDNSPNSFYLTSSIIVRIPLEV